MNTALAGGRAGRASLAAPRLAGLAMRIGRALERWGARHATGPSRDELVTLVELRREAERAVSANDSTLRGVGLPPRR